MVETTVVRDLWPDVLTLRRLLSTFESAPLVEALFVDDFGNWKLLAVMPNLDETGVRPIYTAVDQAASDEEVGHWLLERLVVLGSGDPEAFTLSRALAKPEIPPRVFDVQLPSLPGYSGAVIGKNDRLSRLRTGRDLEADLERFFDSRNLAVRQGRRLDIGWRPDFTVHLAGGAEVLVEAVVVDRRSIKTRVRDASGLANIAARPVILVMRSLEDGPLDLERRYGVVPVFPVLWGVPESEQDLDRALGEAAAAADDVVAPQDPAGGLDR